MQEKKNFSCEKRNVYPIQPSDSYDRECARTTKGNHSVCYFASFLDLKLDFSFY